MVVDAEVGHDVVAAAVPGTLPDHQQRRGLAAAAVAAGVVAGRERGEQPARQRLVAVAGLEGVLHGRDHELAGQDVALDRVAVAGHTAGPVEAGVAGVGRRAALGVDDPDLPVVASVVLLEEPEQGHRGGGAVVEMRERQALVGDVGVGLGGDGTHLRDGGRYDGADGQELGGDGDTPRLTVGGASHDGERHARSLAITVCPQGALKLEDDGVLQRLGFPDVGPHRRFVGALAIDAVGSGIWMPLSMLYFLHQTSLSLVQLGAAMTIANLAVLARGPGDRGAGGPVRPQGGHAGRQRRRGRRLRALPLRPLDGRGGRPDLRGRGHPVRVLGRPRADGHADHRAR